METIKCFPVFSFSNSGIHFLSIQSNFFALHHHNVNDDSGNNNNNQKATINECILIEQVKNDSMRYE